MKLYDIFYDDGTLDRETPLPDTPPPGTRYAVCKNWDREKFVPIKGQWWKWPIYMNPKTGSVQSLEDWQADFDNDEKDLWPGVGSAPEIVNVLLPVYWDEKEETFKELI
jgi:hypothetical protein